jgi:hypothetical protein
MEPIPWANGAREKQLKAVRWPSPYFNYWRVFYFYPVSVPTIQKKAKKLCALSERLWAYSRTTVGFVAQYDAQHVFFRKLSDKGYDDRDLSVAFPCGYIKGYFCAAGCVRRNEGLTLRIVNLRPLPIA